MDFEQFMELVRDAKAAQVQAQIHAAAARILAAFIQIDPDTISEAEQERIFAMVDASANMAVCLFDAVEKALEK
jgi:hypothetical protein